jgi:hypothetical protein
MSRNWIGKIKYTIEVLVLLAIIGVIFEFAIQPALVSIDPMFADQNLPVGEATGRGPETPSEVALYITLFIGGIVYISIKDKIKEYISSIDLL